MRRLSLIAFALATVVLPLRAHDLFLTLRSFFVPANAQVEIHALNGTFSTSAGVVARERMRDVSLVSPAGLAHPDTSAWRDAKDTTILTLHTGASGTYVVGVSTRPKILRLEAKQFNEYLASEGVPEVLAARRRDGELDRPARERYHKHVKALLQVGDTRTNEATRALGYPAELVPLVNPYVLRAGASTKLAVRALVGGVPAANLMLQVGGRDAHGMRLSSRDVRTNAQGVAEVALPHAGRWYVKFISMVKLSGDADADYESRWATLTFEMR